MATIVDSKLDCKVNDVVGLILKKYGINLEIYKQCQVEQTLELQILACVRTISLLQGPKYPEKVFEFTMEELKKCIDYSEKYDENDVLYILKKNNIHCDSYCDCFRWHLNLTNDGPILQ